MKLIYFFILVLFVIACTQQELTQEQSSFRELCLTKGHQWMKMSEMEEGVLTGPACYGCMPDAKNHLCTQNDYEEYYSKTFGGGSSGSTTGMPDDT